MPGVYVQGLEEVLTKINRISEMKQVKAAVAWGAQYLKRPLTAYPEANHEPNPILREKSERGRRVRGYFFANKVRVPYKRTGNLRNRWTVEISEDGLRATVGNNAPYAPGMHDAPQQWRRHKHWPTVQSVEKEHGQKVVERIKEAVEKEVNQ